MAATEGVSVPTIDWSLWAATLAAALGSLLHASADEAEAVRKYAEIQLEQYDAAITRAMETQNRRDNVIPIATRMKPFSIDTIIDDLGFTT